MKFCRKIRFPFQSSPKNQDPSYKVDLEFWDYFERKKNNFCLIPKNMVHSDIICLNIFYSINSDVPILCHKMTFLKMNLFFKDKHQFKAWNLYFIMITYRILNN